MAKKNLSTTTELAFDCFDGSKVELSGGFLLAPASGPDTNARYQGFVYLTPENITTLRTINSGDRPTIEYDDKGNEIAPEIPCCPQSGLPLWKYTKRTKSKESSLLPIQGVYNRPTNAVQVYDIKQSVRLKGFETHTQTITIVVFNGFARITDGSHRVTALGQLLEQGFDISEGVAQIQVRYPETCQGIGGHDELIRQRTIKDILSTMGVCATWETEVQHVISGLILLCSGKSLGGSGKSLPHILNEDGKPLKLTESDSAKLFNEPIPPFNLINDTLAQFSSRMCDVSSDDDEGTLEIPLYDMPTIKRYPLASWLLSIVEVSIATKVDPSTIVDKLQACVANNDNVAGKLDSWSSTKGKGTIPETFPILCAVLTSLASDTALPARKPTNRASIHCRIAYDNWRDSQSAE